MKMHVHTDWVTPTQTYFGRLFEGGAYFVYQFLASKSRRLGAINVLRGT